MKQKRIWEIGRFKNIIENDVCLVCSGIDNVVEYRKELEYLGLSVIVLSSGVVKEVLGVPLGGNIIVIHGLKSLMIPSFNKIKKIEGLMVLYWVIDGICLSKYEFIHVNGTFEIGQLISQQLGRVVGSLLGVQKKIIWLIRENGNN